MSKIPQARGLVGEATVFENCYGEWFVCQDGSDGSSIRGPRSKTEHGALHLWAVGLWRMRGGTLRHYPIKHYGIEVLVSDVIGHSDLWAYWTSGDASIVSIRQASCINWDIRGPGESEIGKATWRWDRMITALHANGDTRWDIVAREARKVRAPEEKRRSEKSLLGKMFDRLARSVAQI